MTDKKQEVWLRGPVAGIPALLQPVAHALLQAREEINGLMENFPEELLWGRPAGVASPGFHLQHIKGVINRLFTYARGEALSPAQLNDLKQEGNPPADSTGTNTLLQEFNEEVDRALKQLTNTDETRLTEFRGVGRAQLPSTMLGTLVHAAEHTQRHTGQLLVTVRVLKDKLVRAEE